MESNHYLAYQPKENRTRPREKYAQLNCGKNTVRNNSGNSHIAEIIELFKGRHRFSSTTVL